MISPIRKLTSSTLLAALFLLLFTTPARADSAKTAQSLEGTVRILESGKVGNVSDFCPHLRRELQRAREQLDAETRDLRRAANNPPKGDSRDGRITEGWARNINRRQRQLQATGRKLRDLERRIDRLCPPGLAAAPGGAAGARGLARDAGTGLAGAGLAGAKIVVTPTAFAGGRLTGQVVGADGQPLPEAPLTIASGGRLDGVVMTDPDGRFDIDAPEEEGRLDLAILGAAIAAASQLLAGDALAEPRIPGAGLAVQPGAQVTLPGRIEQPWIRQGGETFGVPSSVSESPSGHRTISSVHCPESLVPGAATLGFNGAGDGQQAVDLTVYRIESSYLEQDLLRSGQSAGFGWTLDLGAESQGTAAVICAREAGPIFLTGERCQTTTARRRRSW